ncbi:MAG: hypothetical protein K0S01_1450 [Herbinix sp.]|nr:hypothetical protein [Herbinix sp.]
MSVIVDIRVSSYIFLFKLIQLDEGSVIHMILLKANSELKVIFIKLINTMGRDFKWKEVFAINNNNLILEGKDSVLFFDFGNKMIGYNPVELHLKEDSIEQITKNEVLENVLNMTLYVFGKWGKIKGLTVEKDYSQLNVLFGNLLKEIDIEPVLTADNLRFFKGGVQITYEDIMQDILNKQKLQNEEENEKPESNKSETNKNEKSKYNLGLWHKMVWTSGYYSFEREELSESDKRKSRIGHNFYMVTSKCPVCREKLFLVIYPEGKELLIETDEKGVYLSRAYTCSKCHCLYTPKPQKLLREGNVFCIDFEDDIEAYEDYLELIGKQGERTSNCNFNEYELDYNKRNSENVAQLADIYSNIASMSEEEIVVLQDKMEAGFYPLKSSEKYYKAIDKELISRKHPPIAIENKSDSFKNKEKLQNATAQNATAKDTLEQHKSKRNSDKSASEYRIKQDGALSLENSINLKNSIKPENSIYPGNGTKLVKGINTENSLNSDYSKRPELRREQAYNISSEYNLSQQQKNKNNESFVPKDLQTDIPVINTADYKFRNQAEQDFDGNDKNNGIDKAVYNSKEEELLQRVSICKEKNYANIIRVIEEIKKEDCNDSVKESFLHSLAELLEKRGKKELDAIILKVPENVSKTQYKQFKEMIEQYKEIDNSTHKKRLDLIRDEAEKQDIAAYIKRVNPKDRNSIMELYNKLKKEDFEKRNTTSFLENIYDKISAMDEAAIKKICPDPAELTFNDGLQAYEEISSKDILPELKSNILEKIDQRLTKIKMNECEQLVNKLSKDMSEVIPVNSRIHFYDVRKGIRNNSEDDETQIMNKALNTYAAGRGRYEFPIVICDASTKANGGKGFVLTADHIFYNSLVEADVIDVMKIKKIIEDKGLFGAGIYAETSHAGKVKISNSLKLEKLKPFTNVLNDFVSYLKEKPESRDISYMVKEKHNVICCYRCGYVYKGGNVCPKCYAKFNE